MSLGGSEREQKLVRKLHDRNIIYKEEVRYCFPGHDADAVTLKERPVVLGLGPAGLFCALKLSEAGFRPIVLERGAAMEDRIQDVEHFWKTGELLPDSNIQFGEGGAGTFSDGKLTTNVRDSAGRNEEVARIFIEAGAPGDIAWESLPHIGTDRLRSVIVNMRRRMIENGGEVRFGHCVKELITQRDPSGLRRLAGVVVENGGAAYTLPAQVLVLAPGHSSRDLIRTLYADGIPMTQKNFAVGVRVSHPQQMINHQMYGVSEEERELYHLPEVSYKLTAKAQSGRGVYSFCMCPGGYVVNASSEVGHLAVNGMSDYARDSARANSAIVITVGPGEFGSQETLAGMHFQEMLEKRAWGLAGGKIPVETYPDFAGGDGDLPCEYTQEDEKKAVRPAGEKPLKSGNGHDCADRANSISSGRRDLTAVEARDMCLKGQAAWAPVHKILPPSLKKDLDEGMAEFGRRIPGFDGPECLVAGLESRTSSPVRMTRDDHFESTGCKGLYPCGEGAGYAGGITSAAIDGIKVAEEIARTFRPSADGRT